MASSHIVILGGGFAGTTLAQRLERRLPDGCQVTLLSQENYITYNPLLAEVVGATIMPGHVVAPIRQMIKCTRFRMVNVTDIDFKKRQISYAGEVEGNLSYDHLVLACGVSANLDIVPGMTRYALPLKTLGDALFIRNRMMARLEQAEIQEDANDRRRLVTFIIVGGGFSGVEVAAEICDFLHASLRYYPNINPDECRIVLLHRDNRLLSDLSPKLGRFCCEAMRKHGVDVRLNTTVVGVDGRGVELGSGERINGGTVVCTIGTAPHALVQKLGLPNQRGRIQTLPDMSVPGFKDVWALGDCAAVTNTHGGQVSPPTAQFATRQAKQLADNLLRRLAGEPIRPFCYRPLGQMSSIGRNKAVAEISALRLTGFAAWLLWRGVYLFKIPTVARRVRVFVEWTWQMLFPPELVHLRFTRTRPPHDTTKEGEDDSEGEEDSSKRDCETGQTA